MATKTKKKRDVQLMTPFGRAGFCALARPSYKFQPEAGEFSVRIILTPEEAAPLIEELDRLYEQAYQENLAAVRAEKPKVTEIKRADKPYKNVEDPDTGEKLPDIQINFRMKHKLIGKDENGNKTVFRVQKPIVVDSKKQPVRQEVGSGSIIRVSFTAGGFNTMVGSGLSLRLIGVQVKELVQIGSRDPGFDEIAGFEETTTASDPVETTHAPDEPVSPADAEEGDY